MTGKLTFGENLREARQARGWTQQQLADAAGTSKGYISQLESGARPTPPGTKLQDLATALDVPVSQLMRDDSESASRTVPLVGYVGAGALAHYYATGSGDLDWVEAPKSAKDSTVAVEVRGDSLGPAFQSWLVFYDDVRSPITPDLNGALCVVGLPDDRILVKIIKPAGTPGIYHLISNANEPPIFDQEVHWAARVTSMAPK